MCLSSSAPAPLPVTPAPVIQAPDIEKAPEAARKTTARTKKSTATERNSSGSRTQKGSAALRVKLNLPKATGVNQG